MSIVVQRHPHIGGAGFAALLLGLVIAAVVAAYAWAGSDGQGSVIPGAPQSAPPLVPAAIQAPAVAPEPVTLYIFDDAAQAAEFDFLTATIHEPGTWYPRYEVAVLEASIAELAMAEMLALSGVSGIDHVVFTGTASR